MYSYLTEVIAVDFVLLPSDQEIQDIIQLNSGLFQPADRQIVLSKAGNLPHLSLLMGGLSVKRIELAKKKLRALATSLGSFYLKIDKTVNRNDCVSLNVEKKQGLQRLHETLMDEFDDMMETQVTGDMFNYGTVISDSSIKYVNSYWQQSIGKCYWPHITLGYGKLVDGTRIPKLICFDKIGLYHLGNHCTCSKNIFTITLNSR